MPVLVGGAPVGSLYLTEKAGGSFTETDEQVILALADVAGTAIEHARTTSRLQLAEAQLAISRLVKS